jgi:hypothetical protein
MLGPVDLTYELELLPAGRIPFRRWRWTLWHGGRLLAAGWRVSAPHAQRAVRVHALRYAHRLHGLHPLRVDQAGESETRWAGGPVAIDWGDLRVVLTPRAMAGAAA